MGRPIGSANREKPFADALRIAIRQRPQSLRRIANRLIDKAEEGDLPSIREMIDRLDGKAVQAVDCGPTTLDQLTDAQLHGIASGALDPLALPPPDRLRLKPRG
jgi:hypothetical protein